MVEPLDEIDLILRDIARRRLAQHLAHIKQKIDEDPSCPVCNRPKEDADVVRA